MRDRLRRARADDAAALAALQLRAWRAAYASFVAEEELAAFTVGGRETRWREVLAGERDGAPERTLVSEDEGCLTGFALVGPSRDDDARDDDGELHALYVEPARIGTGLGRALLGAGEAELATRFRAATLWVLEPNTGARAFYARHGWLLDPRPFDRARWSWAPSLRLRKRL